MTPPVPVDVIVLMSIGYGSLVSMIIWRAPSFIFCSYALGGAVEVVVLAFARLAAYRLRKGWFRVFKGVAIRIVVYVNNYQVSCEDDHATDSAFFVTGGLEVFRSVLTVLVGM